MAERRALVVGATGGIGAAVARAFVSRRWWVGLASRGRDELRALATELGGVAFPCDVTEAVAVDAMVERFVAEAGGPPDVVVSSAGAFSLQTIDELSADEVSRHLDVNLKGSIHVARSVVPVMKRAGSGILVLVGSVAGRKPLPGNAAYGASKYGLRGFHEVLREELRGSGVRVTLLEPAATDTKLWDPLDPDRDPSLPDRSEMLRPEDVADAVLFVVDRPEGVQIPYLPIERA